MAPPMQRVFAHEVLVCQRCKGDMRLVEIINDSDEIARALAEWIAQTILPSTSLNSAYGFMWWLNVEGHWVLPSAPTRDEGDGKLFPDAPEDIYAAVGALGPVIVVDPTDGYVFVRLGDAPGLADLTGFGKLTALWEALPEDHEALAVVELRGLERVWQERKADLANCAIETDHASVDCMRARAMSCPTLALGLALSACPSLDYEVVIAGSETSPRRARPP